MSGSGPTLSRRTLLLGAGVGVAVGAGGTELGLVLAGSDPTPAPVAAPGETLMYEHGVLKRVLLVYQEALGRLGTDLALAAAAIQRGAQIIHDYIEGFHEALEEGYVFPTLLAARTLQSTVDTLLTQHARGRLITQLLLADASPPRLDSTSRRQAVISATTAFVRMYQPHEAREDTVVFPAFRTALGPTRLQHIGQVFLDLQDRQFGPHGFARTVDEVAAIEQDLGINDLTQFTPAPVAPATPGASAGCRDGRPPPSRLPGRPRGDLGRARRRAARRGAGRPGDPPGRVCRLPGLVRRRPGADPAPPGHRRRVVPPPPAATRHAIRDRHRRVERRLSPWQGHWLTRTGAAPFVRPDGTWVISDDPTVGRRGEPDRPDRSDRPVGGSRAGDPDRSDRSEQSDRGGPEGPRRNGVPGRLSGPARRRRRIRRTLLGAVAVAGAAVGGPLIYFHLVEGTSPAALRLPAASGPVVPGPVSGTWSVGSGSQAGYRVSEVLLGQHHTAVGRTATVAGRLIISGHTVTAAAVQADLADLKSDQPSRDVQFHGSIMETYKHPDASFRLSRPIALPTIPAPDRPISAEATGELTLRGLTRPVTVQIRAERLADTIEINAQIPVTFADWHIPVPNFTVARVSDRGTIELLLVLHRTSS